MVGFVWIFVFKWNCTSTIWKKDSEEDCFSESSIFWDFLLSWESVLDLFLINWWKHLFGLHCRIDHRMFAFIKTCSVYFFIFRLRKVQYPILCSLDSKSPSFCQFQLYLIKLNKLLSHPETKVPSYQASTCFQERKYVE